jgi:CheY-like chemotaxis protein
MTRLSSTIFNLENLNKITRYQCREINMNEEESKIVLLVEDDAINQNVMKLFLKRFGYRVETAGDGLVACDMCTEKDYALILMDCQMPYMDGFAATQKIRESGKNMSTPILALTANVEKRTRERCLSAGMNDIVYKPVNMADIKAAISNHIGSN